MNGEEVGLLISMSIDELCAKPLPLCCGDVLSRNNNAPRIFVCFDSVISKHLGGTAALSSFRTCSISPPKKQIRGARICDFSKGIEKIITHNSLGKKYISRRIRPSA